MVQVIQSRSQQLSPSHHLHPLAAAAYTISPKLPYFEGPHPALSRSGDSSALSTEILKKTRVKARTEELKRLVVQGSRKNYGFTLDYSERIHSLSRFFEKNYA